MVAFPGAPAGGGSGDYECRATGETAEEPVALVN